MDIFIKEIDRIKNLVNNSMSSIEIADLFLFYIKNKNIIDEYFNTEKLYQDELDKNFNIDNTENKDNLLINKNKCQKFNITIKWKDLKKLFSDSELKEDKNKSYTIYIFLNYNLNEIILSRHDHPLIPLTEWNLIVRDIIKKDSLAIFLQDETNSININDFDLIFEKEMNLLHILFKKDNDR